MSDNLKTEIGRLREAGARRILALRAEKKTYQQIAVELGVSIGTVANVIRGRTWSFLQDSPAS